MLFHQIRSKIKNRVREKQNQLHVIIPLNCICSLKWQPSPSPDPQGARQTTRYLEFFLPQPLYSKNVSVIWWSALWSRHVGKAVSLRYHLNNYVRDKYRLSSNKPVVKVQTQCSSVTAHNRHDRHGVVRCHLYPHTYSKAGKRAVTRRTSRFDNETNKKWTQKMISKLKGACEPVCQSKVMNGW